jgi:hypothetical protein
MKGMLLGFALAASSSMAAAQSIDEGSYCDPWTSDTWCLDPYEEPGATFHDGVIGIYRPGAQSAWVAIYNPNNPRTVPPNPIYPTDPIKPAILVRPGQ